MILNYIELCKIASLESVVLKNSSLECVVGSTRLLDGCVISGKLISNTNPKGKSMNGESVIFSNLAAPGEVHFEMKRNGIKSTTLARFKRDEVFLTTGERLMDCVPKIKHIDFNEERVLVGVDTLVDNIELSIFIKNEQLIINNSNTPIIVIDIDSEEVEAGLTVLESDITNKVHVQLKDCLVDIGLGSQGVKVEVIETLSSEVNIIDSVTLYHQQLLKTA